MDQLEHQLLDNTLARAKYTVHTRLDAAFLYTRFTENKIGASKSRNSQNHSQPLQCFLFSQNIGAATTNTTYSYGQNKYQ